MRNENPKPFQNDAKNVENTSGALDECKKKRYHSRCVFVKKEGKVYEYGRI